MNPEELRRLHERYERGEISPELYHRELSNLGRSMTPAGTVDPYNTPLGGSQAPTVSGGESRIDSRGRLLVETPYEERRGLFGRRDRIEDEGLQSVDTTGMTEEEKRQIRESEIYGEKPNEEPFRLNYRPGMDVRSKAAYAGAQFGRASEMTGTRKGFATGAGVIAGLSGALDLATTGLSAYASERQGVESELDRRRRAQEEELTYRSTIDRGRDNRTTGFHKYGGEHKTPAERFNDIMTGKVGRYQVGGEVPMEQPPQEQPMEQQPDEQNPNEGLIVIAQQLMEEFSTLEEMAEYLHQEQIEPEIAQAILDIVRMMEQEAPQQQAQEQELPKSAVMRDTMSGGMEASMGFKYGGRKYPKLF